MSIVLVVPDLHLPFQHKDAFDFLELAKATFKPTDVVCVGDIVDAHANSRYDHDPDGLSPGDEVSLTADYIDELAAIFPEMKICSGNHDLRLHKAAYKAGIPARGMKSLEEIYGFPEGWTLEDYVVIDGVAYEHGDRFGAGAMSHVKAAKSNMRSTVIGHTHVTFGVEYMANRDKLIFAANVGCLVDVHSYAMAYGKAYAGKPILGCMLVRDGVMAVPTPMLLDKSGRWVGGI